MDTALHDLLALAARATPVLRRLATVQVDALLDAGWRFSLPESIADPEPWQWQWRRPGLRRGSKGRFFRSTMLAHRDLESGHGAVA